MSEVVLKNVTGNRTAGTPSGDKDLGGAIKRADGLKVLGKVEGGPVGVVGRPLGAALATGLVRDLAS